MIIPGLICFDIGGVLVRINPGFLKGLLSLARAEERKNLEKMLREQFMPDQTDFSASELYQLGKMSTDKFIELINSKLTTHVDSEFMVSNLNAEIAGEISETTGLLPRLAEIARLGCFTNTNPLHWEYLNNSFSWMNHFEIKLASHLCGRAKPDFGAFQAICEAAGLAPRQVLFIDDRVSNVEAARDFGMDAFVYSNPVGFIEELAGRGIHIEI